MRNNKSLLLSLIFLLFGFIRAQEKESIEETFKMTRIINGHSNETLEQGTLEFRVEHKFGDLAGSNGGLQNFFGIDNAADIRIAFEYGLSDKIMLGLGRSKGYGPHRGLLDGFVKVKLLVQNTSGSRPISITAVGGTMISYAKASQDSTLITFYPEFVHRLSYYGQLILAHKYKDRASFALMPTYTHRNYVAFDDQNGLFSLGAAARLRLTEKFALLAEYYYNFNQDNLRQDYKNSLAFAFEWATFGHVFSLYLANAGGFGEQQFIPYTTGDWTKGQFRAGFAITRKFEF